MKKLINFLLDDFKYLNKKQKESKIEKISTIAVNSLKIKTHDILENLPSTFFFEDFLIGRI